MADVVTHPAIATAVKVPQATAAFWIAKALTTGMGESASDFLVHKWPPAVAVAGGGGALTVALLLQFAATRYIPWRYWLTVAMVGVFGTMAADAVHVALGVPYVASSAVFLVALVGVLTLWFALEGTLSIHSITTRRRELFYWTTVMTTFALGTALGDATANTFELGYFSSGLLFAAVILVPCIAYRWLRLDAVIAFWFAYIVTRPLGASFADWIGVPTYRSGLGLGAGRVSLVLIGLIVCAVWYLTVMQRSEAL